jgi:hypothetical protein
MIEPSSLGDLKEAAGPWDRPAAATHKSRPIQAPGTVERIASLRNVAPRHGGGGARLAITAAAA